MMLPIEPAGPWPWLVATLTILLVLGLPGFLLLRITSFRAFIVSEWLPLSIVLGVGLLSPVSLAVLALPQPILALTWIAGALSLGLGLLCLWHSSRPVSMPAGTSLSTPQPVLLAITLMVTGLGLLLFYLTMSSWTSGDTWYLRFIAGYVSAPQQVPFNWRASWWVIQALLNYLSGLPPLDMFSFYLPLLLMVVSLLAFYSLSVELLQNHNLALLALLLQLVFYLSGVNSHDWLGRGFFDRIVEDKFLVWLVILPVVLMLAVRYIKYGHRHLLLLLSVSLLASTFVHPIGLVQDGLAIGAFALIHLLCTRQRQSLWRVAALFVLLLLMLGMPLAQRQFQVAQLNSLVATNLNPTFSYAAGITDYPNWLGLQATRLWIGSVAAARYLLHPHLIFHPLTLLALLLVPLLLLDVRRSLAAQFLLGNMLIPVLLLYNPLTAPLIGRLITPWLLYRLVWALPVTLVLIYITRQIFQRFNSIRFQPIYGLVVVGLLLVAGVTYLLGSYIIESLSFLQERPYWGLTTAERDLLNHLPRRAADEQVIIAESDRLTYLVPAFTPIKTLYGNSGYTPQARADVASFYQTRLLTPATLQLLERWQVKFIIIERDRPLAFQLAGLPAYFGRRYQNQAYALYQVLPHPAGDPILAGNEALLQGQFARAEAAYRQALAAEPANSAAGYGLGLSLQAQHQIEAAREVWQQLLAGQPSNDAQNRPDDLPVWLALARLYQQTGQFEAAQTELTQARALWPASLEAAELLGDVYLARGRTDAALGAYNQAVLQPPAVAPGQYHLALAELYRRKGLVTQAKTEFQTVIKLDSLPAIGLRPGGLLGVRNSVVDFRLTRLAQAHTALAQLQIQAGDNAAAEAEYRQALTEVTNYQPAYTGLANLFRAGEHPDKAIDLYRLAGRRNPNLAWPHLELGRLYLDRIKDDPAP